MALNSKIVKTFRELAGNSKPGRPSRGAIIGAPSPRVIFCPLPMKSSLQIGYSVKIHVGNSSIYNVALLSNDRVVTEIGAPNSGHLLCFCLLNNGRLLSNSIDLYVYTRHHTVCIPSFKSQVLTTPEKTANLFMLLS